GILDDGVAVVIVCFLLGRPTDHLADGVDLDIATKALCRLLDLGDFVGVALKRRARTRSRHEERITVAQRKVLTHLRGAGIHEDRPRVAVRLGKSAYALELQELSFEIELAAFK